MNILCMKCSEKHIDYLKNKGNNIIYLADQWDLNNIDFLLQRREIFLKILYVKSLDSVEEMTNIYNTLVDEELEVNRVISGAEYSIYAAGFLKSIINKNCNYIDIATKSRNKKSMKNIFKKNGIKYAQEFGVFEKNQILEHSEKFNYPLILKPLSGTGSFNTYIINDYEQLRNYVENLKMHPAIESEKFILEEYINGDEFHVDIIWSDGEIEFISIAKYYVPRLKAKEEEHRHKNGSYTIDRKVNELLYSIVSAQHIAINKTIGFQSGVTHSEFFISKDQIYFSEIATRFAGNEIPAMIENSYCVDIETAWLDCEIGLKSKNYNNELKTHSATLDIMPSQPGIIIEIPNKKKLKQNTSIKKYVIKTEIGAEITFEHPSERGVVLVFEAESEKSLFQTLDNLNNDFKIKVKEGASYGDIMYEV